MTVMVRRLSDGQSFFLGQEDGGWLAPCLLVEEQGANVKTASQPRTPAGKEGSHFVTALNDEEIVVAERLLQDPDRREWPAEECKAVLYRVRSLAIPPPPEPARPWI